jgi:DNA replication protein DnaC
MLKDLRACRADGTHERRLVRYSSVDLLIIDDLGLRTLTGDEPIDLYDIIRQRYERASTVITSNRGLEEWAPLFNDQLLANAAMDRLLHHANVIEVTGASYRNPPSGSKKKAS